MKSKRYPRYSLVVLASLVGLAASAESAPPSRADALGVLIRQAPEARPLVVGGFDAGPAVLAPSAAVTLDSPELLAQAQAPLVNDSALTVAPAAVPSTTPVVVPDPEADIAGFFAFLFERVVAGDYWIVAGAVLFGAVRLLRRFGASKFPFLGTPLGIVATTAGLSLAGGVLNALLAHQPMSGTLLLTALKATLIAVLPLLTSALMTKFGLSQEKRAEAAGASAAAAVGTDRVKAVSVLTGSDKGPQA